MKIQLVILILLLTSFVTPPGLAQQSRQNTENGVLSRQNTENGILSRQNTELTVFDNTGQALDTNTWLNQLDTERVVFIGENHDRYDHHLNQLAIIRGLHEQGGKSWAIGLEMFQQRSQDVLDAYIANELDEYGLLKESRYYQRWGYDYRLYRPILQYAKSHGIQLIALNIADEISRRIAQVGLSGLTRAERQQLPQQIDKSDTDYQARLKAIFAEHPDEDLNFEYFWEAQLAWDESMADRAARFLAANPDKSLIIIAGSGHLAYRSGIPKRLEKRLPVSSALLLQVDEISPALQGQGADFLLFSDRQTLPAAGRMGIMLDLNDGVRAQQVLAQSAAEKAGIHDADRILSLNDRAIETLSDVRLALLDKKPGDQIDVKVQRAGEPLAFVLILE